MPQTLREQRAEVIASMRAMLEAAKEEKRELTQEEDRTYNSLEAQESALAGKIEREENLREREQSLEERTSEPIRPEIPGATPRRIGDGEIRVLAPEDKLAGVATRPEESEYRGMSLGKYVRGLATGEWGGADLERRAMSIGSLAGGGHLVPEPLSAEIIDLARARSRIFQAGARTIPMTASTLKIGKLVKDPEAGWRAENTNVPFDSAALGAVEFRARTLAVIVRASVELWEDAGNLDQLLRNSLSQSLANELDRVGLSGSGDGEEPQGIAGTTDVQEMAAVGDLESYAPFSEAMELVEGVNGLPSALIYAPRDHYVLDRLTDSTGQPLRPPPSFEELRRLRTNQVRTNMGSGEDESEAFLGNFENLLVGMRTTFNIEVSRQAAAGEESAFRKLQVWVRAYLRADIAIAKPGELVHLSGITVPGEAES